jgi:hypothetical protein
MRTQVLAARVLRNDPERSVRAMPPEVAVGQHEHDSHGDADLATNDYVQTAGYAASGEDHRERE